MPLNDEIVKKELCEWSKKEDSYNKPYSVCYDVTLRVNLFETTIKLAEAYNISLEEAIMIGVDVMAKSHIEHYIKNAEEDIKKALDRDKED